MKSGVRKREEKGEIEIKKDGRSRENWSYKRKIFGNVTQEIWAMSKNKVYM